jgi:hypothetical protein
VLEVCVDGTSHASALGVASINDMTSVLGSIEKGNASWFVVVDTMNDIVI